MPGMPNGITGNQVDEIRTLSIGVIGANGQKGSVSITLPGAELAGTNEVSALETAIGAFTNAGVFRASVATDFKINPKIAQVEDDNFNMGQALQIILQDNDNNTIAVAIPAPKMSLFPNRRNLVVRDGTAATGTPARIVDNLFSAIEDALNNSTDPVGTYSVVRYALTTRKSQRISEIVLPEVVEN